MNNKLLIIDDSESIVEVLSLLFEEEPFVLTRKVPTKSVSQAVYAIEEDAPNIILLDHNLDSGTGLEVLDKINRNVTVLSTSISVMSSLQLTNAYREKGVKHFSGKNFKDIKKCLDGKCGCI